MKTEAKIPDHVTIVFTTQEAVNAYEVLMAAVDYFRNRPSPGHDHMGEYLNYVFEIIWNQFADQVVSVAQPNLYLEFRKQNEGGV